jgi:hypothetical protein
MAVRIQVKNSRDSGYKHNEAARSALLALTSLLPGVY